MENKITEEISLTDITRKLSYLETLIVNLLHRSNPFEISPSDKNLMSHFTSLFSKPLKIDDSSIKQYIAEIREVTKNLTEISKEFDVVQTLSEIKYIGNRLKNIETRISEIKEDGIKKKIQCTFSMQGIENITEEMKETDHQQKRIFDQIFQDLNESEKIAIIYRLRLFGKDKHSFVNIGHKLKVSGTTAAITYRKALRKLRRPSSLSLIKNLDPIIYKEFINAIGKY